MANRYFVGPVGEWEHWKPHFGPLMGMTRTDRELLVGLSARNPLTGLYEEYREVVLLRA